mmetsp:Transcript_13567/g.13148  ORF Transcript_13567/g.13148 Transcript_13567/m.13148 type:complete len:95 (+) Transcript_13567:191-475(+)
MSMLRKAADVAHKTTVTGLFGFFGYCLYNIGNQVIEGPNRQSEHPQAGFLDTIRNKIDEEYKKYYEIDQREWYEKEDDSYLKQIPRRKDFETKK